MKSEYGENRFRLKSETGESPEDFQAPREAPRDRERERERACEGELRGTEGGREKFENCKLLRARDGCLGARRR